MLTLLVTLFAPVGYWICVAARDTVWAPSPARPFQATRRAIVAYVYSARHLAATTVKWLELMKNAASVSLGERLQPRPAALHESIPCTETPGVPRFDASFAD